MLQKYKRKAQRQGWNAEYMRRALAALEECMQFKSAARELNVPVMALKRCHKGKNTCTVNYVKTLGSKKCEFSDEQEEEINPESTSAAHARAFNRPVVNKFLSLLREVNDKKQFQPHKFFFMDETSLSTVPSRNCRIFVKKGRKQVGRVVKAERGYSTIAVVCWMRLEVFSQWFDHFLAHAKPTEDDPALLIHDGHLSHTKNLEEIVKARENFVTIMWPPPNCTHKLQTLDVGVMFPLSQYHEMTLEKWMNNHRWKEVTSFQIGRIFG
ncbi:hypothetical protein PR048_016563 [Dryococelus australis]|uniref:DDE-1 domain-containing protein n=1 Tax=Dryococelus australis TaxID=614101 RepID=A0ABQ9HKA5_9NEOP|nr:hypothetical protein PR048_016563 [Dryococelus australis]